MSRKDPGKGKARRTHAVKCGPGTDRQQWVRELRALRQAQGAKKARLSVDTILAEYREDRA